MPSSLCGLVSPRTNRSVAFAAMPSARRCRANSRRHSRKVSLRMFSRTPCSLTAFTTIWTCGWGRQYAAPWRNDASARIPLGRSFLLPHAQPTEVFRVASRTSVYGPVSAPPSLASWQTPIPVDAFLDQDPSHRADPCRCLYVATAIHHLFQDPILPDGQCSRCVFGSIGHYCCLWARP